MKIDINLDNDFEKQVNKLKEKYGEEMTRINGFSDEQLDYTCFIDNFVDSETVSQATIDESANISTGTKDVRNLLDEMSKPHSKLLSLNKIYYEIKKAYGKKIANKWLEDEWSGAIYTHDAPSASFYSYCYAYELKGLAEKGLYFLPKSNTEPPKHLTTFMAHLREFIVWVSNRTAGACALPSFFIYTWYFWNKDVKSGYYLVDPEYYRKQMFQQFIFEVNQIHGRIVQSPYTNLIIMDRNYISEIFGDREFPDGTFVIDHVEDIIEHQKVFMETEAEIRKEVFHTFPVYTYSLLFQNGKFVDEEFARWCNKQNLNWYDSNFYVGDSVTNLASCCRMLNDVSKQKQFQSSIGGSLVEIGSVKVSTINLMRIALESNGDKEKFIKILKDRVKLNMLALDRIRFIIHRNIEKGLLPNYKYGVINLEKQTTTNGLTAMYEAIEQMGMINTDELGNVSYSDEGIAFASKIMDTVNQLQDESNFGYNVSLEIIPAESANIKLCKKDNIIYGDKGKFIYSNQWTSLMAKCSINERIKLASILDKKAGGGQILHIGLEGAQLTEEESWKMLNYIANSGVIYFAYNPKLSICEKSHTFFGDVCPVCGRPKHDEVSRIVGYLVPTSSYSEGRKEEYENRRWYTIGDDTYL
jgi:ribonucleoside-triphosphate reductase